MSYTIGIDTGGTFTDTVVIDDTGSRTVAKASTTPDEPEEGVVASLERAANQLDEPLEAILEQTERFYHGTTLVTNALVEMAGGDVGYLTTKGFTDEMHIGQVKSRTAGLTRQRIQHYASLEKPEPIVEKDRIKPIPERVDYKGEVVVDLDEQAVREAVQDLLSQGIDGIAVNFLWSHVNDSHEQRTKELIEDEAPEDVFVTLASDVVPRLGEYSRGATALVNTFTGPILAQYAEELESRLQSRGLEAPIYLMQANGGVMPLDEIVSYPVKALGSGPAAGVTGSQYLGNTLDSKNIIATDVGGTSFDVGLVADNEVKTTPEQVVNQYTLYQTAVDIESIGSGAGSIAWVDDAGQLHVGPESAGADPGPACYGEGGKRPTVTDADLVLGYLDPEYFVGGEKSLDEQRARDAIEREVASELGMSVEEAAAGIFQIVNSHMGDLLRKMTIERGYDPRQFDLYSYGGAGPMHASFYAEEVEPQSITIPLASTASVYSAFGITTTDITRVEERSRVLTEPFDAGDVISTYEELENRATEQLTADHQYDSEDLTFRYTADMRYKNQVNELEVSVPRKGIDDDVIAGLSDQFETVYEQRYGEASTYAPAPTEIVTFRVTARVQTPDPAIEQERTAEGDATWKTRDVYWPSADDFVETQIYDGQQLRPNQDIAGPAVIQSPETTITVRPTQHADVDNYQNIVIGGDYS